MQTITSNYYNTLDDNSRRPSAKVYVKFDYDTIPFAGRSLQSTTVHEKYPKSILHSSGRLVLIYSKVVSGYYNIFFKRTNVARTLWESEIALTTGNYDRINADLVELADTTMGVVFSRGGVIYQMAVDIDGTVTSAETSSTYTGNSPSVEYLPGTSKYWLAYERANALYYRTADTFGTWSGESAFSTGLTNNHSYPAIYLDSNSKFWLIFQRVSDPTASPVVDNVYYMTSANNGTSWSGSTAVTAFLAGEGSAKHPSIVDVGGTMRYFSYLYELQIQNFEYNTSTGTTNKFIKKDRDANRVMFVTGTASANYRLVIYDRDTATYSYHLMADHGMTSGLVLDMDYDSTNNTFAIATSANGIITYNEDTLSWGNYTTSTTPALLSNYIEAIRFTGNKIYYLSCISTTASFGILDMSAGTHTTLTGTTTVSDGTYKNSQVFVGTNYVVFRITRAGTNAYCPKMRVYDSANNLLYDTNLTITGYQIGHDWKWDAEYGYNESTDELWIPTKDTATSKFGIAKLLVGVASITLTSYYTNASGNIYGLLPNPGSGSVYSDSEMLGVHCDAEESRLYIHSATLNPGSGATAEDYITVFNTTDAIALGYFSHSNAVRYATNFATLDATISKILLDTSYRIAVGYFDAQDLELYFASNAVSTAEYRWHILATEGDTGRVYYKTTTDDSTWSSANYLTTVNADDFVHLEYTDKLTAFWHRNVDGTFKLRWDEDLSAELDISQYTESFEITKTMENDGDTCTITLSDRDGLIDQLNVNSAWKDYLQENNLVRIVKGNSDYNYPAFCGYISGGGSKRARGQANIYTVNVVSKAKNFYKKKITTTFYENQTIAYIAEDVITTYMGLTSGQYSVPSITQIIPTVQFIEEYPMDILKKLYQTAYYFPYFDEEGILNGKLINYAASVDFTYYEDGTDSVAANKAPSSNIINFDYEWSDEMITNKVIVRGETPAAYETTFEEEYMGFISGTAGFFSNKNTFDFSFSADKGMYCVEPRLEVTDSVGNDFFGGGEELSTAGAGKQNYCVIEQQVSKSISVLVGLMSTVAVLTLLFGFFAGIGTGTCFVFNTLSPLMALAMSIVGQISSYYYEIYAKPVGEAIPETITAEAIDAELVTKYGGQEIELEIDNPFLDTYEKCLALAEFELVKAKWFVKQPQLTIVANVAHQVGDVIRAYNVFNDTSYKLYIRGITQRYARGQQDIDVLDCAWIEE